MSRPPEEKKPNHERWVISYADFTTLLLATFVVMYAVSTINSSKFQQMSEAFSTAFIGKQVTIQSSGLAAADRIWSRPGTSPTWDRKKLMASKPPSSGSFPSQRR